MFKHGPVAKGPCRCESGTVIFRSPSFHQSVAMNSRWNEKTRERKRQSAKTVMWMVKAAKINKKIGGGDC